MLRKPVALFCSQRHCLSYFFAFEVIIDLVIANTQFVLIKLSRTTIQKVRRRWFPLESFTGSQKLQ